jgi:multidrug resistance efflux pump
MELLMILTYAAICYAVFKIFRIPLNKWTLPTAVLGGAVLIFMVLLIMNYNHPFTQEARFYFYTTPVLPTVRGQVTEVPVTANAPLKKGDVLFKLDPRPYQFVVDQKSAALAEAEQNVRGMKAAYDAAQSGVDEATAARDRARQSFDRGEELSRAGRSAVITEQELENRRGVYLASEAALQSAMARAEQARLAYQSQIGGVNTSVARLQAELRDAEYELGETTVRAPADGYVTQLFLRPGMVAVPLPVRPVMVFIDGTSMVLAGAFQQNALQRVRAGDEAEVAFQAIPGRVFQARVTQLIDAVAQGQVQPSGTLIDPQERQTPGRALATVELLEDLSSYQLPGGVTAQIAVYTPHWHHFAMIRRILLRMRSWENYIFFEGH